MPWSIGFMGAFALLVLWLVVQARKAGPRQLPEAVLRRGTVLARIDHDSHNGGWTNLGSRTSVRGLALRFDHDDDPQAEANLLVPGQPTEGPRNALANRLTVDLESQFKDYHVHTSGFVFLIRMRGTGKVVGRQTRIRMLVDGSGKPVGGCIENDDDTRAAVGDWIEVERAEVLEIPDVRL